MRRALMVALSGSLCLLLPDLAWSQNRPPSTIGAAGQSVTVQLPTLSFFTVSTTVVVPDRGAAHLGGVGSATRSATTLGSPLAPRGNRGIAASQSVGGMSVSAFVHDFEAMDRALLEQAARQRKQSSGTPLVLPGAPADQARPVASLDAIRRTQENQAAARQSETMAYLAKAQQLEADGKPGVARIYYRMALRRASGKLKQQLAARLERLSAKNIARTQ